MYFIQTVLKRKDILTPAVRLMDFEGMLSERPDTEGHCLSIDHLSLCWGWDDGEDPTQDGSLFLRAHVMYPRVGWTQGAP